MRNVGCVRVNDERLNCDNEEWHFVDGLLMSDSAVFNLWES